MTVKEQLKDYLKSGRLTKIEFGCSRKELTDLLGDTTWLYFFEDGDRLPVIYKYGRIEFYFEHNGENAELNGVMFQPIPSAAENGNLHFNYNRWSKGYDFEKVIAFLTKNNIKFEEKVNPDSEVMHLVTEGLVEILFDCQDTPGRFMLNKVGRFVD